MRVMCACIMAPVERRDLVVVTVGHDHGLRRISAVHLLHVAVTDTQRSQALQILATVCSQRGHGRGSPPSNFRL